MKTADLTALAGTDTLVVLDAPDVPARTVFGRVTDTGVTYRTTAGNLSDRGVTVEFVDADGTPSRVRRGYSSTTEITLAPRQIVRTLDEQREIDAEAEARRAEVKERRQAERLADAEQRRDVIAAAVPFIGRLVAVLDAQAYRADDLAGTIEGVLDADVVETQPNVFTVSVTVPHAWYDRTETHTATLLDLDGTLIDVDAGRDRDRSSFGRSDGRELVEAAAVAWLVRHGR